MIVIKMTRGREAGFGAYLQTSMISRSGGHRRSTSCNQRRASWSYPHEIWQDLRDYSGTWELWWSSEATTLVDSLVTGTQRPHVWMKRCRGGQSWCVHCRGWIASTRSQITLDYRSNSNMSGHSCSGVPPKLGTPSYQYRRHSGTHS